MLITHGAYVHDGDENGLTPVHHLCLNGHAGALSELLRHPLADVHARSHAGATPLHSVCSGRVQVCACSVTV